MLAKAESGTGETLLAEMSRLLIPWEGVKTPRAVQDARILPFLRNTAQRRYMPFTEQVQKMRKEELDDNDWLLVGPRSTPFVLGEASRLNIGLTARSTTWRHENKVDDESHIGVTHELLSEALELFVCIDQYDLFNSAGAEVLVRHLQFVEFEVKKNRDAKAPPDGSQYFRPRLRQTWGSYIGY